MFTQFEANEKHYVRILEITDNSYYDIPQVILKCRGFIYSRSKRAETGISKDAYTITVKVYSPLLSFVLNELSIGEEIFVIGHSGMGKSPQGFGYRITIAEQIYKSDWVSYFSREDFESK